MRRQEERGRSPKTGGSHPAVSGPLELAFGRRNSCPIRQEEELAGQLRVREEYSDLLEQLKTTHDELKVLKENCGDSN